VRLNSVAKLIISTCR